MKRMLTTTALAFTLMLVASFKNTASAQPGGGVGVDISYQTFYDELDPYGRWMDYPDYGYVWVPDAGPDFRPYSTNGHWVWSDDYEWMWVSDYNWGWAPFHYGRWLEDPDYGWIWVPGYEWSPAWVAWRDGGDYYGWAPLRPGISINIGFSLGGYNPPVDYWCFAPRRYITSPRIYDYCVPRRNNVTIINNTTIINNYNYNRNVFRTGPGRRDAERYAGRINPVRFRDADRPGRAGFSRNQVSMYRPRVQHDNNRSFAPRKFERVDRNNGNAGGGRGNNLPQPRNRDDRGFGQRNNTDRQPGNNNGMADRRRIDRNNDNTPNTPGQRRNIFNGNDNRNSDGAGRERGRSMERRQTEQPANPGTDARQQRRDIFNRNNDNNNRNNDMRERRQMQAPSNPGNQPRQERRDIFNRGGGNNSTPQRQSAPRMEQPRQQQPQQQPRQFERRSDNNGGGGGNRGGDNGGGHGRRGR